MRFTHLASTLLIASSVSAQSSIDLTITPADGGTKSTFSWSITGTLTTTGIPATNIVEPRALVMPTGTPGEILPWTSTELNNNSYLITGLSTGLYLHAFTGSAFADIEYTRFEMVRYTGGPYLIRLLPTGTGGLNAGESDLIGYIGSTSGSITIDKPFSFFNEGTWTMPFTGGISSLTISTPIPEPSTYGLILGGLALAGAAIRRRSKK